jgi:hypothetical protein
VNAPSGAFFIARAFSPVCETGDMACGNPEDDAEKRNVLPETQHDPLQES